MTRCHCDSGLPYPQCCGRWHAGGAAPTAVALMRSRYSAFVLGNAGYLLHTWHGATRPGTLVVDSGVQWLGLEVRRHHEDGDSATVEFVARSKHAGRATRLHEISRFVRDAGQGRWFYLDGVDGRSAPK